MRWLKRQVKKPVKPGSRHATDAVRRVPAVLPLVVFEAGESDQLVMTVNGDKATAAVVNRGEVGRVLTELMARFATPARVEVHEQDGTVHVDIVQPPPPPLEEPDEVDASTPPADAQAPELSELCAGGFVPGEEVAVAVVARATSADPEGEARVVLNRSHLSTDPEGSEVVLVGRISKTAAFGRLT